MPLLPALNQGETRWFSFPNLRTAGTFIVRLANENFIVKLVNGPFILKLAKSNLILSLKNGASLKANNKPNTIRLLE